MSSRVKRRGLGQAARGPRRRQGARTDWIGKLHRESLENVVSALIDLLDAMDAAAEDLEADEDCCEAREDDLGWRGSDRRAGDPQDGEPEQCLAPPRNPAGGLAEECETWIGRRVDGKGTPVLVRRRRVIADD